MAEILDSENVEHAYAAGADEVIETRRLGFSLLAHAVTMPGTAALMIEVATSGEHGLFVGALPEGDWAGLPFGELASRLKRETNVLVIGVRDQKLEAGWQVIYLGRAAVLEPSPDTRRRPPAAV